MPKPRRGALPLALLVVWLAEAAAALPPGAAQSVAVPEPPVLGLLGVGLLGLLYAGRRRPG